MSALNGIRPPLPGAPHSDVALLLQVQRGDESALARLYDCHSSLVYSVALRVVHDPTEAEDVLQEIFLQVWRSPATFVAQGSLRGWLAVVTRNRCIDRLRRRRPMEQVDDLPLAGPCSLEADVEHIMMLERVKLSMAALPANQRETLEMAFFRGWTHLEIAEMTQTPLGTVKTRIRSALLTLANTLRA